MTDPTTAALCTALREAPDPATRRHAAEMLGARADTAALPALRAVFLDRDDEVRRAVAHALALTVGAPELSAAFQTLAAGTLPQREHAAQWLHDHPDPRMVEVCFAVLENAADVQAAAHAEHRQTARQHSEYAPLIDGLSWLFFDPTAVLGWLAGCLAQIGGGAVWERLRALYEQGNALQQGVVLGPMVALRGRSVVPLLLEHMAQAEGGLLVSHLQLLSELGDPQAVEPMMRYMQHADSDIANWAAYWCCRMGDAFVEAFRHADPAFQRHAMPFIARNLHGNFPIGPQAALDALIATGDPLAVEAVLGFAREPYAIVHFPLAAQIFDLWQPTAVERIGPLVRDCNREVRLLAVQGLLHLSDVRAVPYVIDIADEVGWVRDSKIRLLEALGTPEALAAVTQWRECYGDQP